MAAAARRKLTGITPGKHTPYDPMALNAYLVKYYGFSDHEMDWMDMRRYFGYIRRMSVMQDEEQAAYERARRQGARQATVSPEEAEGLFIRPEEYEGETVAL